MTTEADIADDDLVARLESLGLIPVVSLQLSNDHVSISYSANGSAGCRGSKARGIIGILQTWTRFSTDITGMCVIAARV